MFIGDEKAIVSRTVSLLVSERDIMRDRRFERRLTTRAYNSTDACDNMKAMRVNMV
jgi:hypothetical protein